MYGVFGVTPSPSPSASPSPGICGTTNAAVGKAAAASSVLGGNVAANAFDTNTTGTRWESVHNVDPQWVQVNLGSSQSICKIVLNWEGAYGKAYTIETSATDTLTVSGSGQYLRMHGTIRGNGYGGWSSGGYISDTRVSGSVESASQQQWYSLQSNFGSWSGSNWNMVFSGVAGAPPTNFSTDPAGLHHSNLATTPVSRDVPYIYLDGANYRLFLPSLRTNAAGASWSDTTPTAGTSVSFSSVFVARPSDSTATIQAALDGGCHVVFTPGVYHVNKALNVSNANTVMLGMGYATIIPDGGVSAITIGDVDGVRIKGMFIDAGTTNSVSLLTVGTTAGIGTSRAANPVTIQDVFFRIGGSIAGKASVSLTVNSSDTVVDHIWAWRADHGNAGTYGWTINTADTGVVVNGNNVLATGLFVEHHQKYEVIWNGQGGRIIFFQNEKPYDPPNQAAWMNGTKKGYAAIKVADAVNTFDAVGLGSYVVVTNDNLIANFNSTSLRSRRA